MSPLTIGALAKRAGVTIETIRYYERRALLPEPPRTQSGYRQYSPEALRRLAFIRRAQQLGFTLEEIAELLALRVEAGTNCEAVELRASATISRIDAKMAELARMRAALDRLVAACRTRDTTDECPILEALEQEQV